MYIGSTGVDGLHHQVYEVVDTSIDEELAGYCTDIVVVLERNDIVRVEDNGRGIPVGIHPTEGVSALELVMTRLHAGGKFDKKNYKVSGGLHGVGVSVVNALSTWMDVTVHIDGELYLQRYEKGIPAAPVAKVGTTDRQGTVVRFSADPTIFEETVYSFEVLSMRLRELAFLNKGVRITLVDERLSAPKSVEFSFEGGLMQFVEYLNKNKTVLHKDVVYFHGSRDDVEIEVGLQYTTASTKSCSPMSTASIPGGGHPPRRIPFGLSRTINEFSKNRNSRRSWTTACPWTTSRKAYRRSFRSRC